jgi:hypothetical protein
VVAEPDAVHRAVADRPRGHDPCPCLRVRVRRSDEHVVDPPAVAGLAHHPVDLACGGGVVHRPGVAGSLAPGGRSREPKAERHRLPFWADVAKVGASHGDLPAATRARSTRPADGGGGGLRRAFGAWGRAVHYDSIGELVASADAVVVGQVAETSRGRVLDQQDVVHTIMNVRVAVEQLWAGRMPTPAFTIEQPGWEQAARRPGWRGWFDPAGERPWRLKDELRLKQGDRGVFFLARDRRPPRWKLLGPEGLYLIDGAELSDTSRSDPTVRTVEAMSVTELDEGVGAAVAAVRRGELKPKTPSAG